MLCRFVWPPRTPVIRMRILSSVRYAWSIQLFSVHFHSFRPGSMKLKILFLICFATLSACMSTNYSWCAIVRIKGDRAVILPFLLPTRHMNGQWTKRQTSNGWAKNTKYLFIHGIRLDGRHGTARYGYRTWSSDMEFAYGEYQSINSRHCWRSKWNCSDDISYLRAIFDER